jgi:hypothetical protein
VAVLGVAALFGVAAVSCSSQAPVRPDLGGTPAAPPRAVILEPPEPAPPAPKEMLRIDPEAESTLRQNLDAPTRQLEGSTPPKVTRLALDHTARSEARGLTEEAIRTATLEEGRRAVLPMPLAPADCVTVIAHGGLGVAEVDVFLVDPKTSGLKVLAQDVRNGQLAIVGGQRGCFVLLGEPMPQAELWVQVRSGAGPVVVGVYRAAKP